MMLNKSRLSLFSLRRRSGALRLRSKISLSVLLVVSIVFISVIWYVASYSSDKARTDAEALTLSTVKEIGNKTGAILNENVNVLNIIYAMVEQMNRSNPSARDVVADILKSSITQATDISCIWIAFEPNAFDSRDADFAGKAGYDSTGRFILSYAKENGVVKKTDDVTAATISKPGEGDYYLVPAQTGKQVLGVPYFFTYASGRTSLISCISIPLKINGKIVGVIGIDFDYTRMQGLVAETRAISDKAIFTIISNSGVVIHAHKKEYVGQNLADILGSAPAASMIMDAVRSGKQYIDTTVSVVTKQRSIRVYTPVTVSVDGGGMTINAIIPEKDVLASVSTMTRNIILVALVGLLLITGVVILISNTIVRPITAMSGIMKQAASLDLRTDKILVSLRGHRDEIGDMANAYNSLKDSLGSMLGVMSSQTRSFASTAQNLAAISEESVASMEEVKASVDEVASLSESNIASLDHANMGVEEMSHASAATAASAEDGAAIAGRTADLTRKAFNEVENVVSSIRTAGERSLDSGNSIKKVNDSVGDISSFVSTITGIADQTNLLALNAAIEAARAGEAGRGFAVVAEEVRKLAEDSGRAAQEVQKLISALQGDSGNASSVIEAMGKLLSATVDKAGLAQEDLHKSLEEVDKLSLHMQTIASAAQEQAASSSEMANSVSVVTASTAEIGTSLSHIQSATAETAAASENVAKEAQDMTEGVARLEELISQFSFDSESDGDSSKRAALGSSASLRS